MLDIKIKSFEELSKRELYDLLQLRQEVFVVEQQCAYLDSDGKDTFSFHVMLFEEERLIAYARVLPPDTSYKGYSSIGRVLVAFSERGKKLGNIIMQACIKCAKEQWSAPIKISAQTYTLSFYKNLGFKVTGEEYLEDDIPHQAMILTP